MPLALVEQYANYFATLSGPWRLLSFSRTFTYQRQRQGLNRRAAMLAAQGEPEQWRVRWTKHYRRMFDTMEQLESLLTIEHYLLYQPAAPLSADVLASTIKEQFLLPAVEPCALPVLIPGCYREHATYLEPLDGPGQPFLRVLTACDVRGEWHFGSLAHGADGRVGGRHLSSTSPRSPRTPPTGAARMCMAR